jgi:DUF4097 and DUF4098 domain-containing protein YvlB
MRHETFPTPGPVSLGLRVAAGEIQVEAVAGAAETIVELEPLGGENAVRAVEAARIECRSGSEVLVEVREERRFGIVDDTPEVRLTVRCPEGARLVAATASADIRARGRLSALEVETASGDVEADDVAGEVRAKAASGDVSLGRISGEAKIGTASGDVTVGAAETSLAVQTASGDQRIDEVGSGRITLKSASGDLRVGVRRGAEVWVDAHSMRGDMPADLDLGDEPVDEDGPTVELKATTMSGDVRIVRAGAPAELEP